MKRPTLIILTVAVVIAGLIGAAIYITSRPTATQYTETDAKEPEAGGGKAVAINNIDSLSNILLPSQTTAFRTSLNTFLLEYLDPNTTSSTIIDSPLVNQDGSITITVESKAPAGKRYSFERKDPNSDFATGKTVTGTSQATTRFTVLINRDSYTTITITVKEYNYTVVEPLST